MDNERIHSLISVISHTALGVLAGYFSLFLGGAINALGMALVVLIILISLLKKALKGNKSKKWWIGNGAAIYIFVWLVSWIIFFNLAPVY